MRIKTPIEWQPIEKTLVNMAVTFLEAGVAAWAVVGYKLDKIAISAAVGAGISAVYNTLIKPYLKAQGFIAK